MYLDVVVCVRMYVYGSLCLNICLFVCVLARMCVCVCETLFICRCVFRTFAYMYLQMYILCVHEFVFVDVCLSMYTCSMKCMWVFVFVVA